MASQILAEVTGQPVMDRPQQVEYQLTGPMRQQIDGVIRHWLLPAPNDNPAMLQMFLDREQQPYRDLLPWSGEFAGKYLTGASDVLRLTGDAALKERLARFVPDFVACQADDGYLGPFAEPYRMTGRAPNVRGQGLTWDAWGHYHAIIGLLKWYEQTGDESALHAANRIGDLLCAHFLDTGRTIPSMGYPEMNLSVVHGLALLYKATGHKAYLDLALQAVGQFSEEGAGDYLNAALAHKAFYELPAGGTRWESLHAIMGLAELYWITGNEDYREAFEQLWWSIAEYDRHNTGGFSSGEQAQGNPYHPGAIETCCTIAWIAMSIDMLRMTGNSIVADELEMSTLNSVVAFHSPEGHWSTYNTPMDGVRIPNTEDIAFQIRPGSEQLNCCSVNAARGFGMISDWALMQDSDGLVLNWFGPSVFKTTIDDLPVSIVQITDYPRSGRIELHVEAAKPASFTIKLRIPHWSAQTTLSVNGESVPARAGTYAVLQRLWQTGDRVVLELDMSPRYWVGERECKGLVSIFRGPLLLAMNTPLTEPHFATPWRRSGQMWIASEKDAAIEYQFEGNGVKWSGYRYDDSGLARVLIDGKLVEVVDQYGPKRKTPFAWERHNLSTGPHTLRLEVTGECSAQSQGTFVNIAGIQTSWQPPILEHQAIARGLAEPVAEHGQMLVFNVQDVTGQTVQLLNYGSAGQDRRAYVSWLRVLGCSSVEFSRTNPSRTCR